MTSTSVRDRSATTSTAPSSTTQPLSLSSSHSRVAVNKFPRKMVFDDILYVGDVWWKASKVAGGTTNMDDKVYAMTKALLKEPTRDIKGNFCNITVSARGLTINMNGMVETHGPNHIALYQVCSSSFSFCSRSNSATGSDKLQLFVLQCSSEAQAKEVVTCLHDTMMLIAKSIPRVLSDKPEEKVESQSHKRPFNIQGDDNNLPIQASSHRGKKKLFRRRTASMPTSSFSSQSSSSSQLSSSKKKRQRPIKIKTKGGLVTTKEALEQVVHPTHLYLPFEMDDPGSGVCLMCGHPSPLRAAHCPLCLSPLQPCFDTKLIPSVDTSLPFPL
eukprot:m.25735 g.25735  ORF g.25735 m.25735 type:complete len:329 (+) comp5797_c0_seq1:116-1102(+)